MIKISISESDNLTVNYNEKNNTYDISISNDDNDCIKREDVINLIEHYRKGFKKIFLEGNCALDGRGMDYFLNKLINKVKTIDCKEKEKT